MKNPVASPAMRRAAMLIFSLVALTTFIGSVVAVSSSSSLPRLLGNTALPRLLGGKAGAKAAPLVTASRAQEATSTPKAQRMVTLPDTWLLSDNPLEAFNYRKLPSLVALTPASMFAACPAPTFGYDGTTILINAGDSFTVDPNSGPVNATTIALFNNGGYTGGISVNSTSGRVSLFNTTLVASNTYAIVVQASNSNNPTGCMGPVTTNSTINLKVNRPPTFTAQAVTRVEGNAVSNSKIIDSLADDFTPLANLSVKVNGGPSATTNGVTVSNLTRTSGMYFADIIAACGATTATFSLTVTDEQNLTTTSNFTVTVTPNPPPVAPTYSATPYDVNQGQGLTIARVTPPSDNGPSVSVAIANLGGYTGGITINNTPGANFGDVTLTNAFPGGATPTITINATDNCGVISSSILKLKINGPPSVAASSPTVRQGSAPVNQTIANLSDPEDPLTEFAMPGRYSISASPINGVTVNNLTFNTTTGELKADVSASCTATSASFTVTATDSKGLSKSNPVAVTVLPNTPPVLSYASSVTIGAGSPSSTINPIAGPSDNGTIASLALTTSMVTACGTISVNSTPGATFGQVTVTGAPTTQQTCTVTIRAKDQCADPMTAGIPGTDTTNATFTIKISAPNVSFNKTHAQASVQPGENAVFQLNFANTGDQDATGAQIVETVPANTTFFANGSSPGWSCADGSPAGTTCTYVIGNIGAGGSGSLFFATTVINPIGIGAAFQSVDNTATYSDSISGMKPATDSIAIAALADMAITKTDNGVSGGPGQTIQYFVSYSNVGKRNAAGVVVTETVPANTTFNAAASLPAVWSCANGAPAGTTCTVNVGAVTGSGGAGTLKFAVDVVAPLPVGVTQVTNTASIIDGSGTDPVTGNNTAVDTTPVGTGPVITPAVVARIAGTPTANLTIATVTDDVAAAASVVVVATSLPAGITVTNITNLGGTIKANVRADCNAAIGNNTVGLKGTDTLGNMTTASLIVNVTANPGPVLGTYASPSTVNLSGGTTVVPSAAPTDNGSITSIVASAPGFTGTFSVNPTTGIVTVGNAGPAGNYTVTVTATDNCGTISTRTFALAVNGAPLITPAAPLSLQQGTAFMASAIATVSDDLTLAGNLTVVKTFSPLGISVTNLVNTAGTITADVVADCTATLGSNTVGLQVTDGGGLSTTAVLTINVTPNTAPTFGAYPATSLVAGTGTTVTPSLVPTDNGTVVSLTVTAPGFTGSLTTNPVTGSVIITNAGPLGTFTATLAAQDNCGASTSTTFTITVTCPTITVTPPVAAVGTVGTLFSQAFTQTGGVGNINFTLNSGTLPTGMSLSASGVLSGTPTQSGTFPLTVKATDINGCSGISPTYTLVINCQTITVNIPGVGTGTVGVPFSQNFTQVGGLGATDFTLLSGALPPGLLLNLNGQLTGTPTQQGSYAFSVKATDVNGCTGLSALYTLVIGCPVVSLAPATLASGTYGAAYSQTVTASPAGTYSYNVTSGALPSGLSLNAVSGEITGTPNVVGTSTFTITAVYYNNCPVSRVYTIVINCPVVTLAPDNLLTGTIGAFYSQIVTANPASGYTYAVTGGALPNGVNLNTNTGVISGTPTLVGTFNFTITATGLGGLNGCTGSKAYTIIINCRTVTLSPPTSLPGGQTAQLYSQTITANPAGPYVFTVTAGALPTGLVLNASTGVISGTPTQAGTFNFSITATDPDTCAGSQAYSVVITCPVITLAPVSLPTGTIGVAYPTTSFVASPAGTYTFAVSTGTLPAGLTLSPAGVLSGTSSQAGTFPITVTATNGQQCVGSRTYTLVINLCPSITVDPQTLPAGFTGTAYNQAMTATGGAAPYTFTRTGPSPLPNGLTLSAAGLLTGTPTQVGTVNFTILATDANGCSGTRAYTLTINACPTGNCAVTLSPVSRAVAAAGGAFSVSVNVVAGVPWTASSSAAWVTLTPPTSGTGPGTIQYTVAANAGATRQATITVNDQIHTVVQAANNTTQDSDSDGIPDSVEVTEGTNILIKDNNIFANTPQGYRLFVMQQYRDFLGREGDAGGITNWVNALSNNTLTRAQVIESFFKSAEFQGVGAPIVRLYFAYFQRIPDYAGLQNWISAYRGGMSLDAISNAFAGSQEFINTYGALDNTQFVTMVYNNVLGRTPDAGGLAAWVSALNGGMSRGTAMLGFSESQEFRTKSANKVYVTMMYVGMLRRSPEQAGFDNWLAYLNGGSSGLALIQGFLDALEYHNRFLP